MLRRSNYDLVDEDGYDMRIPAVSEEAFQYGIVFKLKYVGSLDIPRPSSRTDIISAMRRIRCEYKLRSSKKKKVVMIVSVDGIKIFARKPKTYSSRRIFSPFLRRDHSASSVLSAASTTCSATNVRKGNQQPLARASSALPLSAGALTKNNNETTNDEQPGSNNNSPPDGKNGNKMTGSVSSVAMSLSCTGGLPEDEPPLFHHPIHRIFFVSHYSPDERVFSYIARNGSQQQGSTPESVMPCPFTCFVFKTYKKSEAIRIVRTIGQSFEVCHNLSQKMQQKQQKHNHQQQSSSLDRKSDNQPVAPATKQCQEQANNNSVYISPALNENTGTNGDENSNTPGRTRRQQQPAQPATSSQAPFPMSSSLYAVLPSTVESVERSKSMRQLGSPMPDQNTLLVADNSSQDLQQQQSLIVSPPQNFRVPSSQSAGSSTLIASSVSPSQTVMANEMYSSFGFPLAGGRQAGNRLLSSGDDTFTDTTTSESNQLKTTLTSFGGEARVAVFQRMLDLQRQENEASLAQNERLRQQLLSECDARQAAQMRNYQLLRQNCELVEKLTQLFDRLERVEKTISSSNSSGQLVAFNLPRQQVVTAVPPKNSPGSSLLDDFDFADNTSSPGTSNTTNNTNQLMLSYGGGNVLMPKPPPPPPLPPKTLVGNGSKRGGAFDNNFDNLITTMLHQEQQQKSLPTTPNVSKGRNTSETSSSPPPPSYTNFTPNGDNTKLVLSSQDSEDDDVILPSRNDRERTPTSTSPKNSNKHDIFSCSI